MAFSQETECSSSQSTTEPPARAWASAAGSRSPAARRARAAHSSGSNGRPVAASSVNGIAYVIGLSPHDQLATRARGGRAAAMDPSMTGKYDLVKYSYSNNRNTAVASLRIRSAQVGAAPVQQRRGAAGTDLHIPHSPDHYFVITARQPVFDGALQRGQDPVQPRAAGRAGPVPDAVPGGSQALAGEVGGKMLLRGGEYVDHERAVRADRPQGQARVVKADQHERRIQR